MPQPPVPSEADLADVGAWIAGWFPAYAAEWWDGEPGPPGGVPAGLWRSMGQLPDPLAATTAANTLTECLKNELSRAAKRFSGVTLAGPTGTGKTSLLAAFWRDLHYGLGLAPSGWWHARTLAHHLTDQAASHADRRWIRNHALTARYLALDDLGAEPATPWTTEVLQQLIEDRHTTELPLFVTTNLQPKELVTRYGERVTDRLFEMTKLIPLTGNSKRTKQ